MAGIALDRVEKAYRGSGVALALTCALSEVAGVLMTLAGPSGRGKSTGPRAGTPDVHVHACGTLAREAR